MGKIVKADVTTKSTLYLLDTEDQLSSMKINENEDLKIHLAELKASISFSTHNLGLTHRS